MKVKTYRAASIKAALEQVKKDLGSDAFILSQKEVRPGKLMGVIRRNYVEVTAAVDYAGASKETSNPTVDPADAVIDRVELSPLLPAMSTQQPTRSITVDNTAPAELSNDVLFEEIRKLRSMVRSISTERNRSAVWLNPQVFTSAAKQAYAELVSRGIAEDIAIELVTAVEAGSLDELMAAVESEMSGRIRIHADFAKRTNTGGPQIVALLGPTGVGKTTTLAKIAARAALQDGLKVAMVTLDTFRIAAIEQLKTYGEIIGVPVRVVDSVNQMKAAIQKFSDRDLILIDTTGRSQHDVSNECELAEFMSQSPEITKALVLSATTKQSDLADITRLYEIFGTNCLIFTKLDETETRGCVINELIRTGKPLAYVTIGQSVPQDIVRTGEKQIVELIIGTNPQQRWSTFAGLARASYDQSLQATCQ